MSQKYYHVTVQLVIPRPDGYTSSRGLPTFSLDRDILGITGPDHAASIALHVVGAPALDADAHVSVLSPDGRFYSYDIPAAIDAA